MGALVNVLQHGAVYEFGITDADAPVINGMKVRRLELKFAPEVAAKSQNGEGLSDSLTIAKPDKFQIMATASGVINDLASFQNVAATFTFRDRFFVIMSKTEPRQKGEYVEASVEATSDPLITS